LALIDIGLSEKLKKMVHFRNTVIHQYQRMDVEIVRLVIVSSLDDLVQFGDRVMEVVYGPTK
jgi:uncharacterized protein YutE (UPF0331/DUF86 family)